MSTAPVPVIFRPPEQTLLLDLGTYMWVTTKRFSVDLTATDREMIEDLMSHRAFRVTFCGDELGPAEPSAEDVHGPFLLSRISPDHYRQTDPSAAGAAIHGWANDQDWTPPYQGQSEETMDALRTSIYSLLRRGTVYELAGLSDEDKWEFSFVGGIGYLEFVVIDRERAELHLIVCADD